MKNGNVRRSRASWLARFAPFSARAERERTNDTCGLGSEPLRPHSLYVHGASDTGGAVRAVESIATGLQWRKVRPPACVTGAPSRPDLEACWELGALLAAEIAG
jgi:hypothetical protein